MAIGFSSQGGHLLMRSQAVQGTLQSDLTTAGIAMKLRSGALGADRDLMVPDAEIGGGRDIGDAYLGPVKWSGDYEFYARVDSLATLMKAAMGTAAAPVTATGVTTHTITPSDGAQLPFLSLEEAIGSSLEVYNYTDAVVNTLHLEGAADGYLMGTVGLIAAKQVAGATSTDVSTNTDQLPLIVGTNITLTYNGVSMDCKSFSLDLNNNFEDGDFRLGSLYLGSLVPKRRELTLSVSLTESSSALWRQATYGVSSATAPGGLTTKQQVVLTCSTYETIPASTPPTAYSLTLTIPKVILQPYGFSVSGDDAIVDDISMQAVRPALATPLATAVFKTDRAIIA